MHKFRWEATQPAARPSPGEQPMKGNYQTMIERFPLSKQDTKAWGLDEASQVAMKVGREAPKQAKEKFWRVAVVTTIGVFPYVLQHITLSHIWICEVAWFSFDPIVGFLTFV